MKLLTLGAACLNQTPLDWDGNHRRMVEAISAARDAGVGLLCLPELCVTGYGCEDMFFSAGVCETALGQLAGLADETAGIAVAVGLPIAYEKRLYNAAALMVDGRLIGFAAKQFLAGDGIHYEPRWFRPWPAGKAATVSVDRKEYPFGDVVFDVGGVRVGFEICRDAWGEDRPCGRLTQRGVQVVLNPSASHFAFGKQDIRREFTLAATRDFGVSFVYCNLLGNESGRAIYDGGVLIASDGQMVASGRRFSFADYELTTAAVNVSTTPPADASAVTTDFDWPAPTTNAPTRPIAERSDAIEPWEASPWIKEEEFTRAVGLALFDYLRKSHAGGFVVSLSGGADSSAVSVLVGLMVKMAAAQLSIAGVARRLTKIEALQSLDNDATPQQATRGLLTCVYQATRNSSKTTRDAAAIVAEAVGAEFYEWNVDALVDGYVEAVSAAIGRKLDWENDDIALQNVQARARGPGAWLLANLRDALLLATSNRSEAAVGYATMDGDTCGGLSPIAGIDKAFLRQWLAWVESEGPDGFGPVAELSAVTRQEPTAELRPPSAGQTDEADLMPYPVLDAIERAAVRDKLLPAAALEAVSDQFPQHGAEQMLAWVDRFYRLWRQNQWKRERYAPSFHLDDENLDPKTWCRFPILSAAYERELKELAQKKL